MGISNFLGFFGLLSLPVIVILYMFRPRHKLVPVPSLFLWQEIMEDLSKAKKLEKLKKTVLFILDLLIALLITLLLLGIFFHSSKPQEQQIILINASFSMNSEDIKPNRFEKAKELATEYIENLKGKKQISVIMVKDEPILICNKEEDKKQVIHAINKQKISFENPNLGKVKDILESLQENQDSQIIYFTDEPYKFAENVLVKENSENLAIKDMSSQLSGGSTHLAITIENQGKEEKTAQVSLYDKDLYLDTKSLKIPKESTAVLFFENLNPNISVLKAVIDKEDINPLDNSFYEITKRQGKKKIALISDGNFFVEKFLSLNQNFEVFLIKPDEYAGLSNYDLYIFDSFLPETLPKDGNLLILDPDPESKNQSFNATGYIKNPTFKLEKHSVNKFLEKESFAIGLSQTFEKDYEKSPILSANDNILAYSSRDGLQKTIVFGFDFAYSDLPLKAAFPILMNNVMESLLEERMTNQYKYSANETVKIYLKPSSKKASVISPSKKVFDLSLDSEVQNFTEAKDLGLYSIEQEGETLDTGEMDRSYFAINPPGFEKEEELEFIEKDGKATRAKFTSKKDIDKVLLLLLLILLMIELFIRIRKRPFAKKGSLALRILVILLVLLSFLDVHLSFASKYTDTIFLADYSESMHNKDAEINSFIKDSLDSVSEKDQVGIVSFAEVPKVEKPLSFEKNFNAISPDFNKKATNIEKAVEKAEFMFNKDHKKRLVLLTDGRENAGDLIKKIEELVDKKIALDYYQLGKDLFEEVEIDELNLPKTAKKGENIQIETKISSNVDSSAKIYLYNGNNLVEKKDVEIKKGSNNFVFSSKLKESGILEFRMEILPEKDTYLENNKLSGFIDVDGKLKILIVEHENFGENFKNLFQDFDVTLIEEHACPQDIESILNYDAFIFADVNLENTNEKFIENLAYLIKNQGKSLLVSGGENSYAMGGYYKSKLEEILPVEMKVKDDEKKENIAMVLVIDKSGSMIDGEYGVSTMSLAKEAAVRASEVLEDEDSLGLIAFDGEPHWIVDLNKAKDKEGIKNKIMQISPDGGTSIQPALSEAIKALKDYDAPLKHIILLTDGMAEEGGYEPYIRDLKNYKITLSTVAAGNDADQRLLKYLAEAGGGRYYLTNVFTDIPTIFAKETVLAGKKQINNITFYPDVKNGGAIFDGIHALPKLHGYIATTAKPMANVILSGPDQDPILASYNYGLGKTLAFTSDMQGIWSKDFLAWDKNQRFWHNVLSTVLNQNLSKDFEFSSEYKDNKVHLNLELSSGSGIKDKEIKAVLSNGATEQEILLKLKAPYLYEASFSPKKDGIYSFLASIEESKDGKRKGEAIKISTAFAVPYSNEFRFFNAKKIEGRDIERLKNGRLIENPKEIFKGDLEEVEKSYDLTKILLVLALLLFLLELSFRMTNLASKLNKFLPKKSSKKDDRGKDEKDKNSKKDKKNNPKNRKNNTSKDFGKQSRSSHIDELLKDL